MVAMARDETSILPARPATLAATPMAWALGGSVEDLNCWLWRALVMLKPLVIHDLQQMATSQRATAPVGCCAAVYRHGTPCRHSRSQRILTWFGASVLA